MKFEALNLPRSEIIHLIEEWCLNARNKQILLRRLDGLTYEEIAEEFNLSTIRVKEIVATSYNRIKDHM